MGPLYEALATQCTTGASLGSPLRGSGDALCHWSVTWVRFTRLWRHNAPPECHLGPPYVARVTHCGTGVSRGSPLRGSGDALRHRSVTWVRFMRLGRHNAPPERQLGPPYVARVTHCTTRVSLGSPLCSSGGTLWHRSVTWVPFTRLWRRTVPLECHLGPLYEALRRTVPLECHVGPLYEALATHCATGVSLGSPLRGSGDALCHWSVTWVPFTRLW
ncbi:hypothetical protein NDU88_000062 [Pleurodeles waltl]|uniref:Uncharacterized protein n=1 Tax=Pleurodeles waltl TaxID=8319 RepID=A0AAV7L5C7_PLEWA|nr:hypothetical protein NDU88_000062 [Pleurodeles waltl]